MSVATNTLSFEVRDISGQKSATVNDCPADACVSEVIPELLALMNLPQNDSSGPISHSLRRDSDGAILHDADVVGDVVQPGTRLVLQPSVEAGCGL
ncbi:MAG: hypothetical protein ABSC42_05675 [Tepidisphaeraceae bacterium]|jgi:hypothetical protein